MTGPAGPLATYEYDSVGLLQKVAYPDGSGYTFTYDSVGQVLRVDDLMGRPVEGHTYDSSGYALTSELGDGQEKLTLAYDLVNGITTVTDALGNVTTYRWQTIKALRRVTKITGPCTSCGGGGAIDQEWTYDDFGRVLTYKDGDEKVTTYTYDPLGDLITAVDALENSTGYTKDSQGRTRSCPYICVEGVEKGKEEGKAPRDVNHKHALPWQGVEELAPWKTLALSNGRRKTRLAGISRASFEERFVW